MFYSGQLFVPDDSEGGLTSVQAANIIQWSNFMATIGGMLLLNCFGRRTLMIYAQRTTLIRHDGLHQMNSA